MVKTKQTQMKTKVKTKTSPATSVDDKERLLVGSPGGITEAQKQYVLKNYGEMSEFQLKTDTGLTAQQIEHIITNKQTIEYDDMKDADKPRKIKGYDAYKGSVSMTLAQSTQDDQNFENTLPNEEDIFKRGGVERIKKKT